MREKPRPQGVRLDKIKAVRLASTLRQDTMVMSVFVAFAICVNIIFVLLGSGREPLDFVIGLALYASIYLLAYRRRNFRFMTEDGLYLTRRGYAVHIPFYKVGSARIHITRFDSYIEVQLQGSLVDEVTGTPVKMADPRCFYLPYTKQAEKWFLQHVPVTGNEKWQRMNAKSKEKPET